MRLRTLPLLALLLSALGARVPTAAALPDAPPAPPPAPAPVPVPVPDPVPDPGTPPSEPVPGAPAPAPAPAPGAPAPAPAPKAGGAAQAAATLLADREEHDFGTCAQNQELHTTFTLTNSGSTPIHISKPLPDCGCYVPTLEANDLAPGASTTLKVTFHTLVWSGSLNKKLRVLSNDPGRPELVLLIKVNIVDGVVLDPGRCVFGDVLKGETPSKVLYAKWYEGVGKPFEVTEVVVPQAPDGFAITREPWSSGAWKGTKITVAFKSAPPLGMYSADLLIRTDAPGYERLSVPLQAFVSGQVWVQEREVNLGWVRLGMTKSRSLSIRPFSRKGVDLGKVSARSRSGVIQVEVVPDAADRPGWWRLQLVVPATAAKGDLEDVVEVLTEVKGEEVTTITVKAKVIG